MLGKTAGGMFWMLRYMERSENTARMIDAGMRMSLTRSSAAESEWTSILTALGLLAEYQQRYDGVDSARVVNFLLRDKSNSGSVISSVESARTNARMVRTALTRGNFSSQEIRTLRGVISSIDRRHQRPNPKRMKPDAEKE
mgnify:CR=1 FL=1